MDKIKRNLIFLIIGLMLVQSCGKKKGDLIVKYANFYVSPELFDSNLHLPYPIVGFADFTCEIQMTMNDSYNLKTEMNSLIGIKNIENAFDTLVIYGN